MVKIEISTLTDEDLEGLLACQNLGDFDPNVERCKVCGISGKVVCVEIAIERKLHIATILSQERSGYDEVFSYIYKTMELIGYQSRFEKEHTKKLKEEMEMVKKVETIE